MTGRTTWAKVRDERLATGDDRARYDAARQALDADLALHRQTLGALRRARALTQTQLARSLDVTQAQVSRIENQTDLYLSTLRSYVEAMGGELEMRVVFADGGWAEVAFGDDGATVAPARPPRKRAGKVLRATAPARPDARTPDRPVPARDVLAGVVSVRWDDEPGTGAETVREVRRDSGGWVVAKAGRPVARFTAKREAVARAKQIVANAGGGEVVVARGRA
jgi:transcriptional regulator with XRE-family HTH domain